jgi:diguanylate cyclase (GGDEF)-like protein
MMPPKKSSFLSRLWPFGQATAEGVERVGEPAETLRIVIISQDSALVDELRDGLSDRGHDFVFARDQESARQEVRRMSPHLVIIDWRLPDDLGKKITRSVRRGIDAPAARVLALAPRSVSAMIAEILAAGCDDFLTMPFDLREVHARIHMLVTRPRTAVDLRDPLTGLVARAVLLERIEEVLSECRQNPAKTVAVLYCDIDRFKNVNDGLGHVMGDRLLCAVARRLESLARPADTVSRCVGDEFVVVIDDVKDIRGATVVAEKIRAEFEAPFDLDGVEVFASLSIGIAVWEPQYTQAEDLLRDADTAKYRAKATGRNNFAVFQKAMHTRVVAALEVENDLRRAIARQEFRPHYQPIVAIATGRIVGFEALSRWQHPDRGLLKPVDFIGVAEEMGGIIQMDRWLAEEACRQLRNWQTKYRTLLPLSVAVNISPTHFLHHDLVRQIDLILRNTGLYGESLKIEVTESMLVENTEYASQMLEQLRTLNIGISLDDFGTGYSSLAYLRRFEIDTIKIDQSFVSTMLEDEDSSEIVKTVVTLAKNLGKETVAEGVETVSQLEALRNLSVDHVQGYLIARPMPAAEAETFLIAGNPLERISDLEDVDEDEPEH